MDSVIYKAFSKITSVVGELKVKFKFIFGKHREPRKSGSQGPACKDSSIVQCKTAQKVEFAKIQVEKKCNDFQWDENRQVKVG